MFVNQPLIRLERRTVKCQGQEFDLFTVEDQWLLVSPLSGYRQQGVNMGAGVTKVERELNARYGKSRRLIVGEIGAATAGSPIAHDVAGTSDR